MLWRHCHEPECPTHSRAGPLILFGDAFHNFVDGIVIAAAFQVSAPLGVATALAVIAHELPQELGDFAILLEGGYSRAKALLLNGLSASATLPCRARCSASSGWPKRRVRFPICSRCRPRASFTWPARTLSRTSIANQARESLWQVGLLALGIGTIALFRLGH